MLEQTLSGNWLFRQAGSEEWLPAVVPGSIHLDLLAAGRIPDPFIEDNERLVQWVPEKDWEYSRVFVIDPVLLAEQKIFLVCDQLDTLAEVRLNGVLLGNTDNMFRTYRWDVTQSIHPGENQISLVFHSPVRYIRQRYQERPLPGADEWIAGGMYIRKAACHFGWDWGPHIPTVGIERDIRLEAGSLGRIEDAHLRQEHTGDRVVLSARLAVETWFDGPLSIMLRVTDPDGQVLESVRPLVGEEDLLSLAIDRPHLWWPNGYGAQPLYQVEAALLSGERLLDRKSYQIGLRTIELVREPDQWGQSFTFMVNGLPVFCKGSNWIPADSFPARVTPAQLEHLIASAAATHQNMLRVWGGGYYESEIFYDLCDRYGILVWQDFMFACQVYPLDQPDLVENIRMEVIDTVRRLRHRTCLALWCGNNEMDEGWSHWGWHRPDTVELRKLYEQFFHHILPEWVYREDPDHAYWPSSPSSGTMASPNSGMAGDIHQWDVWHGNKPFSNYQQSAARFVSEFGFQSLPGLKTVAFYAPPEEWNMTSYLMEYHQRNALGNGKIMTYMTSLFRLPKDFDALSYISQLLQSEAIRIGVEHWRRARARTGGTLYWQLNDCWPVASWSSIDYFGRWKALQYAARQFYAPILLSIDVLAARIDFFITSDLALPVECEVHWSLETVHGEVLTSGRRTVSAAPLATTPVDSLALIPEVLAPRRDVVLVYELWQEGVQHERKVQPLVPDKHLPLEDPGIQVSAHADGETLNLQLAADSLARFVELSMNGYDGIWSDNYFDLPARRSVTITCPLPRGWTVARARAGLRIRSLVDSY